jgi:hypothetical protein
MPDYDAMKEVLGKTIKGVIVKKNTQRGGLGMSVHLVFTDGTAYEIYTDFVINFSGGFTVMDIDKVRKYGVAPLGPMENVLDISLDER